MTIRRYTIKPASLCECTDAEAAYRYAMHYHNQRWPEGEKAIAKSTWAKPYLEKFPDAKLEWLLVGWLDWLDPHL